jgi:hypothetical protein
MATSLPGYPEGTRSPTWPKISMTFQKGFRLLLEKPGIDFDERYVWD